MNGYSISVSKGRPRVIHVTTAHLADDVRIFDRECRSIAESGLYDTYLAAPGSLPSDAPVNFIPLRARPKGRVRRFLLGPRRASALRRALSVDLWHFHDPELLPLAILLARSGERIIWDAHEDYGAQFGPSGAKNWVPGPLRRAARFGTLRLITEIDKRASAVVAATPAIAARYRNPSTVLVGNEARLEQFIDCSPEFSSRSVLFTGTPTAGHLFPEVAQAIADLGDVRLIVAGREPDAAIWRDATEALGDRLVHLGWLDRRGLAAAISSASIGLLTYADTESYDAAFPTKGFEFAAAGLPIVSTPNRMIRQQIELNAAGTVAAGFSAAALSEAIGLALSDENSWTLASHAGRRWAVRDGSWSYSEERLLDLYASLLQ